MISIRVRPRNVYAGRGTQIEVTGVNELQAIEGTLKVEVRSDAGTTVDTQWANAALTSGITPLFSRKLNTTQLAGACTVRATLTDSTGRLVTGNEHRFHVFTAEQLAAPKARIAVLDLDDSLRPFLRSQGIEFDGFDERTELAVVPLGRGRCIASQLRLVDNLGKDPVADRILFNLINWTSQ